MMARPTGAATMPARISQASRLVIWWVKSAAPAVVFGMLTASA